MATAHASALRDGPPARRPERLPAGASGVGRLRRRAERRATRDGTPDPRATPGRRSGVGTVDARCRASYLDRTRRPSERTSPAGQRVDGREVRPWADPLLAGPLESGRTRLVADLAGRAIADGASVEYARGDELLALFGQPERDLPVSADRPRRRPARRAVPAAASSADSRRRRVCNRTHRRPDRGHRRRRRPARTPPFDRDRSFGRWSGGVGLLAARSWCRNGDRGRVDDGR